MSECPHYDSQLHYADFFADAQRRTDNGEKQVECPVCGLFVWESLFPARTEKAGDDG